MTTKYGADMMKEDLDLTKWIRYIKREEKRYKNATDDREITGALTSILLAVISLHEQLDDMVMRRLKADEDLKRQLETGNENVPPKTAKIYQFKRKEK